MADEKLMIDTSILIDYFRKTDKTKTRLLAHFRNYRQLYISTITEFEVFNGATAIHQLFWEGMLQRLVVLDFNRSAARQAALIVAQLRSIGKNIDKPDLFIAATAVANQLYFDTLNIKHFMHISDLYLLSSSG